MRGIIVTILAASFMTLAGPAAAQTEGGENPGAGTGDSTTDHSKLKPLMREFASGPEVTAACLTCHTEASDQVMHTLHFTWDFTNPATGQTLGVA